MPLKVGDKLKNNITGKVYELKRMTEEWALLEEENRLSQILIELDNIKFFYGKMEGYPSKNHSLL